MHFEKVEVTTAFISVHLKSVAIVRRTTAGEALPIVYNCDGRNSTRKIHTKRSTLTTKNDGTQIIWTTRDSFRIKACKLSIDLCKQEHYYEKMKIKMKTLMKEVEK